MSGRNLRIAQRLAALTPDQRLALEARLQRSHLAPRPAPAIVADGVVNAETTAPVSFAQQRLWLIDRMRPQSPAYNMPAAVRLRGIVRHDWIEDGLRRIIDRHAVLRTTFRDEDGTPVQVVHDRVPFELGLVDLSAEPAVWREQQAAEIARQEATQPFSLAAGPLIRGKLIRLAAADHVFLVTMHHIVSDGWSFDILLSELSTIYQSLASGREPVLPALALQYADYARSERAEMQGERLQRLLAYWRDRLEGAPQRIALPIDRAGHGAIGNDGALHRFVLGADVVRRLHTVCAGEQVTPYMACLAAFVTLLYRYSDQTDLVVGTAVSNRPSVALEALIGFFVNNVAIRVDFSERPTFRQTLQRVRTTVLEALRHQGLPFDYLVQELRPDRVAQANPLFQIMFAFQTVSGSRTPSDASAWTHAAGPTSTGIVVAAKFDLSLLLEAGASDIVGLIEYNTAIFEAPTIARMAAHFEALLDAGLGSLDCPTDRLPWPGEPDRAVHEPQDEGGGRGPSLHELVGREANTNPTRPAIRAGSEILSYGALDRHASQLAHFLIGLGVRPGEIIGLCFEPSFDMLTSMIAAFRAGAAYLPLDPAYPIERLRYMTADARVRLVLTHGRFVDRFGVGLQVVDLDGARAQIEMQPADATGRDANEHDLAYVIYTSGSTGRPKGVAVPHRALFNVSCEQRRLVGVTRDSLVLQFSSHGFDASVFEMVMAIGAGACLVLPSDRRDLESLALEPDEARRLIAIVPPSLLAAVGPETSFNPGTLILAGEAFSGQLATPWLRRGVRVFNAYGPTEATIWTCLEQLAESPGRVSIGRSIRNVRAEVLDEWLARVPVGVPGEICIGGQAVAWGYVGRPDLTAEHFVPDPYSPAPGARLYRTGDRGRRFADGRLEFLGRRDHQIKMRGYRIEIGEVESVVAEHPAVGAVAVVAADHLCAYVVCRSPGPSREELVDWTSSRLPAFMVPSVWVQLDALPVLPSGKVDRARLVPPHRESPPPASAEPATETERVVAAMFAELLEVDRIGLQDNFFRLGGHSLLAVRLLARVAKRFGVSLSLTHFFDRATVASVVEALLTGAAAPARATSVQPIPRGRVRVPARLVPLLFDLHLDSVLDDSFVPLAARVGASIDTGEDEKCVTLLPASSSQQRLWFLDKLSPHGSFYNIPLALPLRGPVDAEALSGAIERVAARHEALRTHFEEIDGAAMQVVVDRLRVELPVVDLAGSDSTRQRAAIERLMAEEMLAPFDLGAGPLVRTRLLRLSDFEHLFLLTVHHSICDGWSVAVVAREIETFYVGGPAAPVPEMLVQFGDWALDEQLRMRGPLLDTLMSYWRQRLAGIPATVPIPTDYTRPALQSHRGRSVQFHLAPDTTARLTRLASETRSTLFMTLLAAFQTFLSRVSGERDIVVGSPIANRAYAEVEHTVGFFVNNVVLRTQVAPGASFRHVLEEVRRRTIQDFDHAALPFDRLVEELQPERLLSRNPLFQVMFVLQNTDQGVQRGAVDRGHGLPPTPATADDRTTTGTAKFDLLLAMRHVDGHLGGAFEYSADLFAPESAVALSKQFTAWLDAIGAASEQSIDDLSALSDEEARRLLEWGDGGALSPRPVCLHQLLASRAAENPEAPAIRARDDVVSYGHLQKRIRRLACALVQRGVRERDSVGICIERSVDLVVAMAAVATVGAQYVLLEPSVAPGLTASILRHVGAVMLIVHASSRKRSNEFEVVLDLDGDLRGDEIETDPPRLGSPDSPVCRSVDITTPDEPRTVVVTHAALLAGVLEGTCAAFDGGRRTAQAAPLNSYLFAVEVWGTLLRGGELVTVGVDAAAAPEQFARELRAREVDLLFLPPSMARATLDQVPGAFADVNTLVLAGEPVSAAVLQSIFSAKSPRRVLCGHGGVEYSGFVALGEVIAEECRRQWVAIGRPVAGVRCRVVDESGRLAPVGVPGRLCLAGPRLDALHLTGPSAAEVLSGDCARWRSDGRLEFLGRSDRSVWLSGTRVDLNDIEAAINAHPAIARSAARVWTFASGDERLIAYLVSRNGSAPTTSELRRFLRLRLPAFMVPVAYIELEAIPLTPGGDADFGSLPRPDVDRPDLEEPYVAPSTAVQRALFRIWSEVFGVERIGIHDNFFQLGGHSLLAARVMSRAADAFQVELPLRVIFEDPTIEGLSTRIEKLRTSRHRVQPFPIAPVRRNSPLPLSFAQRRMWFLDRLHPGNAAYNMPTALPLQGPIDAAALERALLDIGRRHESLRTRFVVVNDEPVQEIAPEPAWKLRVGDLRSHNKDERLARVRERWDEETREPFDLERGPLVRCLLLRLDDEEHVLIVTMHHIVADGWSLGLFFRELAVLYESSVHGCWSPLPKLRVQYGDYAVWQHEWLHGGALDAEVDFWRQHLRGAPALHSLPTDRPRPLTPTLRGDVHHFTLPAAIAEATRRLGERCGATLFMTLLTALNVLTVRYGGDPHIVVGVPVANRPRAELEQVIGFFVNTMPVHTSLDGNPTFAEALQRVRAVVLEAHDHQALPFERLVEILQPERHLDRHPIFQLSFVLQNASPQESANPANAPSSLVAATLDSGTRTSRFDLTLAATETAGDLPLAFEYATDLFDAGSIQEMAAAYIGLLESATRTPDRRIADLCLGNAVDASDAAIGPQVDWGQYRSVPALIEDQMRRTPENIAVMSGEERWTYADLDRHSMAVASALRACGIGPESTVGVFARRSSRLVAAIVGTLRSGAAFVPLDPEYPPARIQSMVQDASVDVALVDRAVEASAAWFGRRWLVLEDVLEAGDQARVNPVSTGADPDADRSAYVIFTSGSTGRAKGCINTHGGLRNRLLWMQSYLDIQPDDVMLQKTPFTFDVSVWEFLLPFLVGARLVVAEPDGHRSPGYLVDTVEAHGVTTIHFVPSMLQVFLGERDLHRCATLRRIVCSGEALTAALRDRCLDALNAQLFNLYGPTEASIDVTAQRCDCADRSPAVPIGLPIANIEVHVLDGALRPVPRGVPGEIYLGGVGLARGYANQPDLTADCFVPHPLCPEGGRRLYRTGDRGRRTTTGAIEYLGRVDDQVKVGGVRIEPGELESHILRHPGVEHAAVAVRGSAGAAEHLAAYVVPDRHRSLPVRRGLEPFDTTPFVRAPEELELANGMTVYQMSRSETAFLYREIFEERCYERFGRGLEDARTVVDVGAHIGLFSLYASLCAPGARIIAIEPLPDLSRVLRHNLRRYDIDAQVVDAAAGCESTTADLTYFPGAPLISGRLQDPAQARRLVEHFVANEGDGADEASRDLTDDALRYCLESVSVPCRVVRLSDVLRSSGMTEVDFLKIDVEGSELDVLHGIDEEHWSGIGQVALEVQADGDRLERIGGLLRSHGFVVEVDRDPRLEGTNLVQLHASRAGDGQMISNDRQLQSVPRPAFAWCSGVSLVEDLRSALKANLPAQFVPSEWLLVDELPVTTSGKLDRRKLSGLDGRTVRRAARFVAARTERERLVAIVWAEVLGVDRVGVHDNFFELGGHSLLAARGAARLRDRLSIAVPVRAFFEHPTIAELTAALTGYPITLARSDVDDTPGDEPLDVNLLSDAEVARRLQQLTGGGGFA